MRMIWIDCLSIFSLLIHIWEMKPPWGDTKAIALELLRHFLYWLGVCGWNRWGKCITDQLRTALPFPLSIMSLWMKPPVKMENGSTKNCFAISWGSSFIFFIKQQKLSMILPWRSGDFRLDQLQKQEERILDINWDSDVEKHTKDQRIPDWLFPSVFWRRISADEEFLEP